MIERKESAEEPSSGRRQNRGSTNLPRHCHPHARHTPTLDSLECRRSCYCCRRYRNPAASPRRDHPQQCVMTLPPNEMTTQARPRTTNPNCARPCRRLSQSPCARSQTKSGGCYGRSPRTTTSLLLPVQRNHSKRTSLSYGGRARQRGRPNAEASTAARRFCATLAAAARAVVVDTAPLMTVDGRRRLQLRLRGRCASRAQVRAGRRRARLSAGLARRTPAEGRGRGARAALPEFERPARCETRAPGKSRNRGQRAARAGNAAQAGSRREEAQQHARRRETTVRTSRRASPRTTRRQMNTLSRGAMASRPRSGARGRKGQSL